MLLKWKYLKGCSAFMFLRVYVCVTFKIIFIILKFYLLIYLFHRMAWSMRFSKTAFQTLTWQLEEILTPKPFLPYFKFFFFFYSPCISMGVGGNRGPLLPVFSWLFLLSQ